jgi:hypothetical protein
MFTDQDIVDWGEDHLEVDAADAAMLGWHGSRYLLSTGELVYGGQMRFHTESEECWLYGSEMQLGDDDLEFLHLSSCQSLNWELWASWWRAFAGLHVLTGFHGTMYVARDQVDAYENFANESFHTSIADAWLDNFYRPLYRDPDDQCPVAYAVGSEIEEVLGRLSNERYNHVQRDPRDNTAHGAMWIGGCDPSGSGPLPYFFSTPLFSLDNGPYGSAQNEPKPQPLGPQQVRKMVEEALPHWDERLLKVNNGENWVEQLSIDLVLRAVDAEATANERTLRDEEIVRLHRDEGKIYYVNRQLAWDLHDDETHKLMSEDDAADRLLQTIEAIGVPMTEIGDPHVATQVLKSSGPTGSDRLTASRPHQPTRCTGSWCTRALSPLTRVRCPFWGRIFVRQSTPSSSV